MNNKDKNLNVSKEDNSSDKDNSFFKEKGMLNTTNFGSNKKSERVMILDRIRELAPMCISKLARELKISRSKIYYIVRDFEFAGVVETKLILQDDNTTKRIVTIPDYKKVQIEENNNSPVDFKGSLSTGVSHLEDKDDN